MGMNRKLFSVIIVVVLIVLGAALVCCSRQTDKGHTPKEIVLGVDFSDVFSAPVLIAEDQGYFRDEGLVVKIVEYPSGRTALADMISKGNINVVTAAQTPVMYNSFSKSNYSIIAGMAYSYDAGGLILARQDKGIRTAVDLKGRRVGTPVGSTGHFFLNLFLLYNGLKISDVQVVDIDAPNLSQALSDGRVDAISIWQPQIHVAQKLLGEKAVIFPGRNIYRVDFYLIAHKDFLNRDPAALAKLLKAVDRAEAFIRQNRDKSIGIISRRLKLDSETVSAVWDIYQFKLFLDQAIITDLEAEARWAIENRYTRAAKIPDYRNYISANILEAVKPETASIIR
jgi:ABC-type nitrate/sulfonate/bicarbonate transport system substrate-binding protein